MTFPPGDLGDLDDLDQRLIRELQLDGRAPMEAVAGALGLSRATVRSRYERLLARGALHVVGVVDPAVQGVHAFAHLSVFVSGSALDVAKAIALLPTTPLVSIVAGRASLIAEVRAADMPALHELIRRVKAVDGVHHVEAATYTQRIKDRASPTPPSHIPRIDDLDRSILDILQAEGRIPYARLGRAVNCSPSATRARVQALIASGVVRVTAIATPGHAGLTQMCGLGLRLRRADAAVTALAALSSVSYLSLTVGRWDAIATLLVASPGAVVTETDRIRALPGVDSIEAWTHLEVVKEDYRLELAPRVAGND
ncbi:MAG: Lrp/AsnC family transcriptional regulator [Acidimicrobiales bacterium]